MVAGVNSREEFPMALRMVDKVRKYAQVEVRDRKFLADSVMGDIQLAQGTPLVAVMEGM